MSDGNNDPNKGDGEAQQELRQSILDQHEGVDWHLAHLIYEADIYGIEPGITLTVGGMLITGTLISGRKYFHLLKETYEAAARSGQRDDASRQVLLDSADRYGQFQEIYKFPEDHPLDAHRPHYIHLMHARFYLQPGKPLPNNTTMWRGKLTSVDGVIHGTLDTE